MHTHAHTHTYTYIESFASVSGSLKAKQMALLVHQFLLDQLVNWDHCLMGVALSPLV